MLNLSWLTKKQSPRDELFLDLYQECSHTFALLPSNNIDSNNNQPLTIQQGNHQASLNKVHLDFYQLSARLRARLEKSSKEELRLHIVNRVSPKDGCSPFFIACKRGYYKVVKYLLEVCEADVHQRGYYESIHDRHVHSVSPIWIAAVSGHLKLVELLITHNADINSLSDTGSTPLRSTCFQCRDEDGINQDNNNRTISQALDEEPIQAEGESDNKQNKVDEETHLRIVKLLVERGADISIANYSGGTCLINSIHNYRLTCFLIDNGADVNASDHEGNTALHYAIHKKKFQVIKLLLSRGANPMIVTKSNQDALQLVCIDGHLDIFEYLIANFNYPKSRIIEAYKLLGSSILELNYDIMKVRELWSTALALRQELIQEQQLKLETETSLAVSDIIREIGFDIENKQQANLSVGPRYDLDEVIETNSSLCDTRRSIAFGDIREITTESELLSLSADEFRIQSLIMSERILGPTNRETIQRLVSRGTSYIKSLRPDRCIDLWIYALQLQLGEESIFNAESIIGIETITNLFLDLLRQGTEIRFQDIYDVLNLLIDQLEPSQQHLNQKPVSYLHQNIFDRLLEIIKNLLLLLDCTTTDDEQCSLDEMKHEQLELTHKMIERLVSIDPRTSNGSSLLHICIIPGLIDKNDGYKVIASFKKDDAMGLIINLIDMLVEKGMKIDVTNHENLTPLQVLCSTNLSFLMDKKPIIERLIEIGAHLDRRTTSPEQGKIVRQSLRDAGIDTIAHLRLSCLAARKLAQSNINFDANILTKDLRDFIEIH